MHTITAAQFRAKVVANPAWASTLTEVTHIRDFCDMSETDIEALSPLLHFDGRDTDGNAASFRDCPNLQAASGTFAGFVDFTHSFIERIGDLTITGTDERGNAVSFENCYLLKTATGTYPGHADFGWSAIESIKNLHITIPNNDGCAAPWTPRASRRTSAIP